MILDSALRTFRASTYRNPEPWFLEWWYGGRPVDSGLQIGPQTALSYAPYYQAIQLISGDIGKIPLVLYKRTSEGRERDRKHPAFRLMLYEFNDAMAADVGKQLLQSHALSWGNGRAAILRNLRTNDPEMLVPMRPDRTRTIVQNGEVWHLTKVGDSTEETPYRDENVLHIKGLGFDGITGYSVATMARNSLGLGLSTEKHGSFLFKNRAMPGIILECEGKVNKQDALQMLQDWDKWHGGVENTGKTGLLHSGIKAHELGMKNDDAQWLETRKFQRVEVASWFNLPPHKLGDDSRVSYNSLEQENLSYLNICLLFWFVRWQQECRRKLLRESEKEADSHYFEYFVDMLASVDFPAKVNALNTLVAATIFNPNEAREKLNMNHRDGGDVFENPNTNSRQETATTPPPEPQKGDQGPPGEPGRRGRRGRDGAPGAQGPAGRDGLQGEQGPAGAAGERGPEGPQGAMGTQGLDGKRGDKGEIGPAGPQGERGEQGPAGKEGQPSLYGRCLDTLSEAIAQEVSIVRHHAATSKNFTGWIEAWYPKRQSAFTAVVRRLGADDALAVEHCGDSLSQLMALTERTTLDRLADDVRTLTGAWHERAVVLARRIAGGSLANLPIDAGTMVSTPSGLGTVAAIESDWQYQVDCGGVELQLFGKDIEVIG